jgi:methylenetetrahydrofolate reductase (NADPH)
MRDSVDAINLTDNQRGTARMSALGGGIILEQLGIEPIVQITCQNRNRLALQADVLSGAALGIRNFLCMTGDNPRVGDHPESKNVLDLNSFRLIKTLRQMRDEHCFESGTPLKGTPHYFVGGVANPNIEKVKRLEKKIEAGAEFIQTQLLFDPQRFREWMQDVRAAGLHQQSYIMAGILVLRSAETATHLRDHLSGITLPDKLVERMQRAEDQEREGITIAAELVTDLLSVEGVAGVHLMSIGWTRSIPWVIEQAGLLPRPPQPPA